MTEAQTAPTKAEAYAALKAAMDAKAAKILAHKNLRDTTNKRISTELAAATKAVNDAKKLIGKIEADAAVEAAMNNTGLFAKKPESNQASPPAPGDNAEA